MGSFSIHYGDLSSAVQQLKNGAAACRRYSDRLDSHSQRKLITIEGGSTGNVWDAYTSVSRKQQELHDKADRLDRLGSALAGLEEFAQQTDRNVAADIARRAQTFQLANGLECGFIESAWEWLCDGVRSLLSKTELGQMLLDALRNAGTWIEDKWRRFRAWLEYEGGRYIINIVVAVVAVVAAIATILTAGAGVLAFIGVIGAYIGIANGVTTLVTNGTALLTYQENPYAAERCAEITSFSDSLREGAKLTDSEEVADFLNFAAGTLDTVDFICSVFDFLDLSTSLYENLTGTQTLFQRYLGEGGIVDSIFTIDVADGRATRVFDNLSLKWYECGPDGNILLDENTLPKVVDFKEATDLKLSLQAGIERLRSTPYSFSGQGVDITVWDSFKGRLINDLSSLPASLKKGTGIGFNRIENSLNTTKELIKGLHGIELTRMVFDDAADLYKNLSGFEKIETFFTKYREGAADAKDCVKAIQAAIHLPENTIKVFEGDWWELGDIGKITEGLDKLTNDWTKDARQSVRESISEAIDRLKNIGRTAAPAY